MPWSIGIISSFNCFQPPDKVEPGIIVERGTPLQPAEWCSFIEDDGRINKVEELKEKIFRGVFFLSFFSFCLSKVRFFVVTVFKFVSRSSRRNLSGLFGLLLLFLFTSNTNQDQRLNH